MSALPKRIPRKIPSHVWSKEQESNKCKKYVNLTKELRTDPDRLVFLTQNECEDHYNLRSGMKRKHENISKVQETINHTKRRNDLEEEKKEINTELEEEEKHINSFFEDSAHQYRVREGAKSAKEDMNLTPWVNHFVRICQSVQEYGISTRYKPEFSNVRPHLMTGITMSEMQTQFSLASKKIIQLLPTAKDREEFKVKFKRSYMKPHNLRNYANLLLGCLPSDYQK